MPDPIYRTDPAFPQAVLRALRDLDAYGEAEALGAGRKYGMAEVHAALVELTAEVRALREAVQPIPSALIHGDEAVRAYRQLPNARVKARPEAKP